MAGTPLVTFTPGAAAKIVRAAKLVLGAPGDQSGRPIPPTRPDGEWFFAVLTKSILVGGGGGTAGSFVYEWQEIWPTTTTASDAIAPHSVIECGTVPISTDSPKGAGRQGKDATNTTAMLLSDVVSDGNFSISIPGGGTPTTAFGSTNTNAYQPTTTGTRTQAVPTGSVVLMRRMMSPVDPDFPPPSATSSNWPAFIFLAPDPEHPYVIVTLYAEADAAGCYDGISQAGQQTCDGTGIALGALSLSQNVTSPDCYVENLEETLAGLSGHILRSGPYDDAATVIGQIVGMTSETTPRAYVVCCGGTAYLAAVAPASDADTWSVGAGWATAGAGGAEVSFLTSVDFTGHTVKTRTVSYDARGRLLSVGAA